MEFRNEPPSPIPPLESIAVRLISPVEIGPPDIIPGLLPRHGELVIAGETDIGKSLVALEICSCLVTGQPLWGHLYPTLQARRILYVLGEHYNEVIQRLWQKTGLPMTDQVFLLGPDKLAYDKWLVAQGKPSLQAIDKFKRWAEGVDLIVFDPFSAFVSGVDAENDNIQMRLVLDTMSLISQSTGASCLVLAHQGKPSIGKDGQEYKRRSYAIRGASAIEDAATNIFYMSRADGDSAAAQDLPANAKVLEMVRRKYKGEAPEKYLLMRNPETLVHTLLGNRPYKEVQQFDTQQALGRLQGFDPDLNTTRAVGYLAAMKGVSKATVWNHLGRNGHEAT